MMLSLTINNSTTEFLSIAAFNDNFTSHTNAATTFVSKLNTGAFYSVLIVSSTDNCKIINNTGTMGTLPTPISPAITITCAKFTVDNSGINIPLPQNNIVGLSELPTPNSVTLSLSVNGTFKETTTVTKSAAGTNTTFTFANTRLFAGDTYNIQIVSSTQSCKISSNTGIISTTLPANITNVLVTCAKDLITMTLGHPVGTLTAPVILSLTANGVVVENQTFSTGSANLATLNFSTKLYGGDVYNIQIVSTTENCAVIGGVGTAPGSGAIAVSINCGQYTIGGSIINSTFCNAGSATITISVLNNSMVPADNQSITIPAACPGVATYTSTLKFRNGDAYKIDVSTGGAMPGFGNRCSFSSGVTVISSGGTFGPGNVTQNIYCF
jgi:hypothetical protein